MRRALLAVAALFLLASPLAAQRAPADSLQLELARARAFNRASETQLTKTLDLLERFRGLMLPSGSGVWTMVLPTDGPWHAVATIPADSGWAKIVLDSAGVARDSATYWARPRK